MTTSLLPTEKKAPTLSAETSKVLLYGPPKIGKTTLAADLDPDHTIFLATEPGHDALEVFVVPVEDWDHFRRLGAELVTGEHAYTNVVIDTADVLAKMCTDAKMKELGAVHPSDLEYGKGWSAVVDEFQLRVSKLAQVGGLWMVSHAKDVEIKQRVGTITRTVPTLAPPGILKWAEAFCDHILYVGSQQTEDGEQRILRTQATENFNAGGRVLLPDPLPMPLESPAGPLKAAMEEASKALGVVPLPSDDSEPSEGEAATEDEPEKAEPKPKPSNGRRKSSRVGKSAAKAGAAA
jgi:hypothetical protein